MTRQKATHKSNKTGNEVFVEKYEGGTLVVKSKTGKVLGSYERTEMKAFYEKYTSLRATNRE